MHILTLYITNKGEINLASFGQTLLEDHTPGGIGNPLVIRTMHNEKVIKDAEKIVKHVGYNGVANFDLKYDKRDGKYKFFELNPRLGRSNYYVKAQVQNPVKNYIAEYIDHKEIKYSIANNEVLYSIIPKRLLLKYIESRSLKDKIKKLYKEKKVKNPMIYLSVDKSIKRIFYVFASTFNFYRKFKKYPRSEEHTSELQSRGHLVCRLLLEKKNLHTRGTLRRWRQEALKAQEEREACCARQRELSSGAQPLA